jgi:hypothetical protein
MKKLIISMLMVASLGIFLPEMNYAAPKNKTKELTAGNKSLQISIMIGQPRRRRYRRSGRWYGYKNYGQYRRTQVGHRRYRVYPRYYWSSGRRYVRYVRIYY